MKCGITPENKDILYGPDIPMLKREQRNVREMGAFEYRYSRGNKKIDTSWVDKLCSKYGIEDHMVAAFGGDEELKSKFEIQKQARYSITYITVLRPNI